MWGTSLLPGVSRRSAKTVCPEPPFLGGWTSCPSTATRLRSTWEVDRHLALLAHQVDQLDEVGGIGSVAVSPFIAEIGVDVTRFPIPARVRGPSSPQREVVGGQDSRLGIVRARHAAVRY